MNKPLIFSTVRFKIWRYMLVLALLVYGASFLYETVMPALYFGADISWVRAGYDILSIGALGVLLAIIIKKSSKKDKS